MGNQKVKPNYIQTLVYLFTGSAILLFAMYFVPPEIYEANTILISAVLGILSAFFFYRVIDGFRKNNEIGHSNETDNYSVLWFSFFTVLIPVFLIIFQSNRKDNLLLQDGVAVKGIVVGLKSYTFKRSTIYEARIKYLDANKVEHIATTPIEESEYYKVRRGDELDIYYSTSNPQMVSLLISEYNRKKFEVNNFDLGIMEERSKTKEEMVELVSQLEKQIKDEQDKSKQIEMLNELMLAKNQLKQMK